MEFKAAKHIGLMAIVTDHENEIAETLRVDTLKLMSFVINYGTKQMQLVFAWGGYDSTGKFHLDPTRPAAQRQIIEAVDGEREIWQDCAVCPKGNPLTEFNEDFFRKILVDHKKLHDIVNGGWRLEDVHLTHKGETVFKKDKR